jgi:hypothetical protein
MGQMLAPMIQQMTPSGTAIPFMGEPVSAADHLSSKRVQIGVRSYVSPYLGIVANIDK